jgi:hypothetical protein
MIYEDGLRVFAAWWTMKIRLSTLHWIISCPRMAIDGSEKFTLVCIANSKSSDLITFVKSRQRN